MNYNVPTEMRSMMIAEENTEVVENKKHNGWKIAVTVITVVLAVALCGAAFIL